MLRLLGILITVLAAIAAAVVTWPQFFRLERTFPFAQIVSLRGAMTVLFAGVVLLMLLLCLARPLRGFAASLAIIALAGAAVNGGILLARGAGGGSLPEKSADAIRVMTWNTAGAATDPQLIAKTAIAMQADVVSLPETTIEAGEAVAIAMRGMGSPMWAHHEAYPGWAANSTTLLISPSLGDYSVIESTSGDASGTATVPTVVAMPVSGSGPTIVAAHAVAPRQDDMEHWRESLTWLGDQCASENVIMAGDFNATIDHMDRLGVDGGDLGRCHDAAIATGAGAVGTWSTDWPALLGTPIDHVLATDAWTATGSVVVTSLDDSGSDHRPLVVQLEPTAG
ncbi:MAG: endonuclease/exonuclease/phosphatase family protein [Microbacterium sp.]